MKKKILILEKTSAPLEVSQEQDYYNKDLILSGIFTEFDIQNNNKRIYTWKEFEPHYKYLKEKCENNILVGHIDHPISGDMSTMMEDRYSDASHLIQDIEYDTDKNCIVGKIKVLDTQKGKDLKALIDGGVKVSISSRAIGSVNEDNTVSIERICTYDVVASPGMPNAQLNRINESLGYSNLNENLNIYELDNNENENTNIKKEDIVKKENEIENLKTFIYESINELNNKINANMNRINKPSELENNHIERLQDEIIELKSTIRGLENHLNENVDIAINDLEKEVKRSSFDNHIPKISLRENNKNDYIINNLTEKVRKIESHLNENVDTTINHLENHINENVDTTINRLENHINRNVDTTINRLENHINENVDTTINRLENHINRNVDTTINRIENHLNENVDTTINKLEKSQENNIKYFDYIHENISGLQGEIPMNESTFTDMDKIDQLLEIAKVKKVDKEVNENVNYYLSLLPEDKKNEFIILKTSDKQKVANALSEQKPYTSKQVISIMESALKPIDNDTKEITDLMNYLPYSYIEKWESLNENQKTEILNKRKYYILDSPRSKQNFWINQPIFKEDGSFYNLTRNLNENVSLNQNETKNKTNDLYFQMVLNNYKNRF